MRSYFIASLSSTGGAQPLAKGTKCMYLLAFYFHPPDLLKKCAKFSDDWQASRFLLFCFFLFRIISEVFAFEVFAFEVFVFRSSLSRSSFSRSSFYVSL